MIAAHWLGQRRLRTYSSRFSRHDFTLPQLFACLALIDLKNLSLRRAEVELADSRGPAAIGMTRTPDHTTLHRARVLLLRRGTLNRMLDEMSARAMPKLGLGVDTHSGLILSAEAVTGMGSDAPLFEPLFYRAWRRHTMATAVFDAGFESEKNHTLARQDMGVASIMPPKVGRPGKGRGRARKKPAVARLIEAGRPSRRQQHDQAQPGLGVASPHPWRPRDGDALQSRGPQPDDLQASITRVATEPARPLYPPFLPLRSIASSP
jgi:hypothetical protein